MVGQPQRPGGASLRRVLDYNAKTSDTILDCLSVRVPKGNRQFERGEVSSMKVKSE